MRLSRSPYLNERARLLRRSSTEAELHLWRHLRVRNPFGVKFRRQRPIGPYIVDFYCPEFGLIIELDGSHHMLPDERIYDEERTAYLVSRGLRVLRFTNEEVLSDTQTVIDAIHSDVRPSP